MSASECSDRAHEFGDSEMISHPRFYGSQTLYRQAYLMLLHAGNHKEGPKVKRAYSLGCEFINHQHSCLSAGQKRRVPPSKEGEMKHKTENIVNIFIRLMRDKTKYNVDFFFFFYFRYILLSCNIQNNKLRLLFSVQFTMSIKFFVINFK